MSPATSRMAPSLLSMFPLLSAGAQDGLSPSLRPGDRFSAMITRLCRPARVAVCLFATPSAVLPAQQPAFTLEQVLSAPFPEELVPAPTGGAVAWVFNDRGA